MLLALTESATLRCSVASGPSRAAPVNPCSSEAESLLLQDWATATVNQLHSFGCILRLSHKANIASATQGSERLRVEMLRGSQEIGKGLEEET